MGDTIEITKAQLNKLFEGGEWITVEGSDFDKTPDDELFEIDVEHFNQMISIAASTAAEKEEISKHPFGLSHSKFALLQTIGMMSIVIIMMLVGLAR